MNYPEHKYCSYYWITLQNFNQEEWERFKEEISPFQNIFNFDGIDEDENSVCLKFNRYVPQNDIEVRACKELNLSLKKGFIKAFSEDIRGKVYFNASKGILKKL